MKTTIFILLLTASFACGQTLSVLYTFQGNPFPIGSLVQDSSGNLYGVTGSGGDFGFGMLYELGPDGTFTVLHSFANGADGANPYAGLTADGAGNVYGTTEGGYPCPPSCGSVFEYSAGTFTVLHTFLGTTDGAGPSNLLVTSNGTIYGATVKAGPKGAGTIFRIANGKFKTLHAFATDAHGADPVGSLVIDSLGNLYGATEFGGTLGYGTIFKLKLLSTGSYNLITLHNFSAKEMSTETGLSVTPSGMMYGISRGSGIGCNPRWGGIYKFVPTPTGAYKKTVIHNFCPTVDGSSLVWNPTFDGAGNLYGTTQEAVYAVLPQADGTWLGKTIYWFGAQGSVNFGSLLLDGDGNLYGTGRNNAGDFVYRISGGAR